MNVILLRQTGHDVELDQIGNAYRMLEEITGIKSRVRTGSDMPYFYSDSTYDSLQQDIVAWVKWYDENKCNYSMKNAEAVMRANSTQISDYNDPLVIENLRIKYGREIDTQEMIKQDSLNHEKFKLKFPDVFGKVSTIE